MLVASGLQTASTLDFTSTSTRHSFYVSYDTYDSPSVHGEYRLSPLEMPAPSSADGRLSGNDMAQYMARFTTKYLQDRIEFGLDISNIRRGSNGEGWLLDARDVQTGKQETRPFTRLVVCTGVRG